MQPNYAVPMTSVAETKSMREVRVRGSSDVMKVAKTIVMFLREGSPKVEVRSIGASATNQAVKAIAIARSYAKDLDIVSRNWLATTDDIARLPTNGNTAVTLVVQELSVIP